jgi:iron complex transport system substrate-binding protein
MKFAVRLLLAAAGLVALGSYAVDIVATDDRGSTLRLPAPAARIVALAPSITELVYAAGAGDKLAAVPRFSDYPPEAAALPQIGDASSIDVERVLSLKPDLLIGWKSGNRAADIARLERLGFRLFVIEPATLADVPRVLRAIGALAGTDARADAAARAFEGGVQALRARYAGAATVRVFYEIWHQPLMTVNRHHMISDVMRLCGGENIFAELPVLTPVVSLEDVIARKPEVVLGGGSAVSADELAALWRRHADLAGLRGIPALRIDPDSIQRQTPRVLQGAEQVCAHLDSVRKGR